MAADFKPTAVYSMDDLRGMLTCNPDTFLERLRIPRRMNGLVLGADICAAMARCGEETFDGSVCPESQKQFTRTSAQRRKPAGDPLEPIDMKTILAQRSGKKS